MSKLRELLAAKAGQAATQSAEPVAAQPKAGGINSLIKQAKAKQAQQMTDSFSNNLENSYVPPPSAPLDDFKNMQVSLTADVTEWPDATDGFTADATKQLRMHIDKVKAALVTADVSETLNACLRFIHDNPNLKDLLLPEDVGTLVQALSSSASVVISTKNENKSNTKKRKAIAEDVMNDIASIGF